MDPKVIASILVPLSICMIPIMTRHQQRMAELLHRNPENQHSNNEIANLRADIARLNDVVSGLAINMDNMNDKLNHQSDIQNRVKVNE